MKKCINLANSTFNLYVLYIKLAQNTTQFWRLVLENFITVIQGAQWLSGRVLDSRQKGRGFEPHRRHCVVSLSKNINPSLVLVQPRKTCPFITERLLMGRKELNQTILLSFISYSVEKAFYGLRPVVFGLLNTFPPLVWGGGGMTFLKNVF